MAPQYVSRRRSRISRSVRTWGQRCKGSWGHTMRQGAQGRARSVGATRIRSRAPKQLAPSERAARGSSARSSKGCDQQVWNWQNAHLAPLRHEPLHVPGAQVEPADREQRGNSVRTLCHVYRSPKHAQGNPGHDSHLRAKLWCVEGSCCCRTRPSKSTHVQDLLAEAIACRHSRSTTKRTPPLP